MILIRLMMRIGYIPELYNFNFKIPSGSGTIIGILENELHKLYDTLEKSNYDEVSVRDFSGTGARGFSTPTSEIADTVGHMAEKSQPEVCEVRAYL